MNTQLLTIAFVAVGIVLVAVLVLMYKLYKREGAEMPVGEDVGNGHILLGRIDDLSARFAKDQGSIDARMAKLDSMLTDVQRSVDNREGVIKEQMSSIGAQVANITSLFSNDRARGSWGELSIERIFENVGMTEGRDYTKQFAAGEGRPDIVVHLPGNQKIVIDSKFPVARYLDALAEEDGERRKKLLVEHGKELENVGKGLNVKKYSSEASGGFVLLYLPSQAVYEAAAAAHPEVIERLLKLNVLVVGPVNVFAVVKTVGTLMAEHRAVDEARQIIAQVRELRSRLGTFADHFGKVGKALTTAVKAFNSALQSWNSRLAPQVNKVSAMAGVDELAYITEVEEAVREADPIDFAQAG